MLITIIVILDNTLQFVYCIKRLNICKYNNHDFRLLPEFIHIFMSNIRLSNAGQMVSLK